MVNPLPNKEMMKYASLWRKFKKREFTHSQAQQVLKEKDRHRVTVFFYDLKKNGWLKDSIDKKDKRKRLYRLISPEEAIKNM